MDYHEYTAEDFAGDDEFREWVNAPTYESEHFWRQFLLAYPERYQALEEGRRLVLGLQALHDLHDPASGEDAQFTAGPHLLRTVWTRLEHTLSELEKPTSNKSHWTGWRMTAVVALVMVSCGWWALRHWATKGNELPPLAKVIYPTGPEWVERINDTDHIMHLQLADGSRVELQKDSRLRYSRLFGDSGREVYLTGVASFKVVKNPKVPFLVYTNKLVTKVLGTSFEVRANPTSPDVIVEVKAGRVSVYSNVSDLREDPEATGMILTPNQKAVFHRPDATMHKSLVDKPVLLLSPSEMTHFAFEAAPAVQVLDALAQAYGIDVVYDEELLINCKLTINLTDEDLYQKLEVISKVLNARYKLIDGQVILYSRGC